MLNMPELVKIGKTSAIPNTENTCSLISIVPAPGAYYFEMFSQKILSDEKPKCDEWITWCPTNGSQSEERKGNRWGNHVTQWKYHRDVQLQALGVASFLSSNERNHRITESFPFASNATSRNATPVRGIPESASTRNRFCRRSREFSVVNSSTKWLLGRLFRCDMWRYFKFFVHSPYDNGMPSYHSSQL